MNATSERRIVLLGKSGSGKSSLGNTLLGDSLLKVKTSPTSETSECQAESKFINGRNITVIDTPGFFGTTMDEDKLKKEIVRCITECAPGAHAFLIVLKVDRFTKQEQAVITKIREYFSEEALKYAVIVFTHGDQLSEGERIEDFVSQNKDLSDLVKKCGGRCHVLDNKYWNDKPQGEYRSNQFQVAELLNTIDKMVENNRGCYTNEVLQAVEEEIQQEEEKIRQSSPNMTKDKIREQAKISVYNYILIKVAGTATGALLGAVFGVAAGVAVVYFILKATAESRFLIEALAITIGSVVGGSAAGAAAGVEAAAGAAGTAAGAAAGTAAGATGTAAGAAAGTAAGATGTAGAIVTVAAAAVGAVRGGYIGYYAADGADTVGEAVKMAAGAVTDEALQVVDKAKDFINRIQSSPK